jgi:hypothetical protein
MALIDAPLIVVLPQVMRRKKRSRLLCLLNRAACNLKRQQWQRVRFVAPPHSIVIAVMSFHV